MSNIKNRKEGGFTIIEVLIVLAIAGLIMLIVFLAVPALQRNSRNTQRKNDASAISTAIANFVSNNGGSVPTATTVTGMPTNTIGITDSSATNVEQAKLGYYTASTTKVKFATTTPAEDEVNIASGYKCNANGTGLGSANARSVAVLYTIENSVKQCIET